MAFDISNPFKTAVLTFAQQLLGTRYPKYHEIIVRASTAFATLEDAQTFCKLLIDTYDLAYMRAVDDCKKQVEGHGLKIVVKADKKKSPFEN
jgi:hypothetical protein